MSSFLSHFIACCVGGAVGVCCMLWQMREQEPGNLVRCVKCRHRDRKRGECELLSAYECAVDSMWPIQCDPLDGCTFGEELSDAPKTRRKCK